MNIHSWMNSNRNVDLTEAATITTAQNSDWLGFKGYKGVVVTFKGSKGRAAAVDDTTISFWQAKTNAGVGAKAFTPRRAWLREGATLALANAAAPVMVDAAATFTTNGDGFSILEVEIDASTLDVDNGFAYVQGRFAAVASATRTGQFCGTAYGAYYGTSPDVLKNPLA